MNRLSHYFVSEAHKRDRTLLMLTCSVAPLSGGLPDFWHLTAKQKDGTTAFSALNIAGWTQPTASRADHALSVQSCLS